MKKQYSQEIIDSIQLKEMPPLATCHVKKYMRNTNPRSVVSIGGYNSRMVALGMSREEVRKRTDPYVMVVNNLQKKIDKYMEKDNTPLRSQLTGYLVALALGMLIDHEKDYPGLFNLDKLQDVIVDVVVRYAKCHIGLIFKNWPSFDNMVVPDYVFSWVETPAYLESELYLHFRDEV